MKKALYVMTFVSMILLFAACGGSVQNDLLKVFDTYEDFMNNPSDTNHSKYLKVSSDFYEKWWKGSGTSLEEEEAIQAVESLDKMEVSRMANNTEIDEAYKKRFENLKKRTFK